MTKTNKTKNGQIIKTKEHSINKKKSVDQAISTINLKKKKHEKK